MFTYDQARELLYTHIQNQNLRRHCYAVAAVMEALAKELRTKNSELNTEDFDEERWEIAGLVHDADYEETKSDTSKHVLTVIPWLKEAGADEKIIEAVLAHGWKFVEGCPEPKNHMEWSLYCCDELTGFIIAVALVRPEKKLAVVTVDSVLSKFPKKAFAAAVDREQIGMCEEKLGIPLPDFVGIALHAMQSISRELGL
ncbi:MAG: Metal dependent phosphohydrolase [Candidatus Gottesmanbacteria bacterium GW2011_GWC2_39_8]|uniref:Metal dependent phosphohydrolase n=1 Tax=Candidatus Gottesmanbacteria bacterium GW2011_GWC2_39_8 TaxID=1618450 RepID=A0A0G0SI65_9BACT|nr:MAG: Metal dependent phosphohydrolase [Candidatus Gottesmanbacteria bacterium GW2011_GWC2_39_8]